MQNNIYSQLNHLMKTYHLKEEDRKELLKLILEYGYYSINKLLLYNPDIRSVDHIKIKYKEHKQLSYQLIQGILLFETHFKAILSNVLNTAYSGNTLEKYLNKKIKEYKNQSINKSDIKILVSIRSKIMNKSVSYVIFELTLTELLTLYKHLDCKVQQTVLKLLSIFDNDLDSKNVETFSVRFKQLITLRNHLMHGDLIDDLLNQSNNQYKTIIHLILSFI